ncbi:N-formylglutamate amidohydrolase [Alphaproteobacteria bacterium GH1-50]|uniref:N-formylglutamate amidohydrolase n=1 Tax=Kangsaoukella pontilimi TaxID=2691042 RepID=A0A7C9IE45_9RHOB|nr:N-formylglutamate amidohydrolase [Kangsaoukella pontilimi]
MLPESSADVATVIGQTRSFPLLLVCEHASDAIPAHLENLGLADADRYSHAVFDIGAAHLAERLSDALGVPLVIANWSRLIYDLNRPPEAPDAIPARVETIDIPGNRSLSAADREARAEALYYPFHKVVSDTLDAFDTAPTLVTIHSFTPVWNGAPRAVEIGFLHDADPTLAEAMLAAYDGPHRTALNEPYSAKDGVTHTLARHATARGLRNVMIEVRNDLLSDDAAIDVVATALAGALTAALEEVAA